MTSLFPIALLDEGEELLSALQHRGLRLATAESCTGGLLAGLLTENPGASATLERGFVTYSNEAKTEVLGVEPQLIERCGAVSEEVARAMAEGALSRAPVEITLALTGIAGPDGGTAQKPVGLVYVAAAYVARPTMVRECRFGALSRREIRLASVQEALGLARAALTPHSGN
jgi:nicotinamide-nucleotide amidase